MMYKMKMMFQWIQLRHAASQLVQIIIAPLALVTVLVIVIAIVVTVQAVATAPLMMIQAIVVIVKYEEKAIWKIMAFFLFFHHLKCCKPTIF